MASIQYVVFRLSEEEFGVEIKNVREIIKPQQILRIPNTPKYIEGIINLRGRVHPVFNLRRKFHFSEKPTDDTTKIIVVNVNDMSVGFEVDDVSEILRIEEESIEEAPQFVTGPHRKYIKCVGKVDDRMIIMLDLDLLLSEEEEKELRNLVKLKHEHHEEK